MPRRRAYLFKKVRGKRRRFRGNPFKKNVEMGFHDLQGRFHPIRASADYREGRVGGTRKKSRKKARRKKHSSKKRKR